MKEYRKENQGKINEFRKNKYKTNLDFKIAVTLRNSLRKMLKLYTKTGKIHQSGEYGVDYKAIIEYLKPFPEDLSNYEIHHKKPLFTFNFVNKDGSTNLKEVSKAFAPDNHKWLTIKEHKEIHKNRNANG